MPQLLEVPAVLKTRNTFGVFDDFDHYVTADTFSTVATDSGTVTVSDTAGGVVTLDPSDGTVADNDETYLKGTKEIFLFANDKPLVFESRVKFTEANTDDANILAGLMDAVAANSLVDDGAGPPASYSGMNFHKVDGQSKWIVETSIGASQTTSVTTTTAGGAYQTLRIEFKPITTTEADVTFFVDGVPVQDTTGRDVKHRVTYTGATEMQVALGVKNGGANRETLLVDYVAAFQKR
jgi:hypothetical protein